MKLIDFAVRVVRAAAFALIAAFVFGAAPSFAFSVQPLLVEIEPGQAGTVRIENNRSDPLVIEARVYRRSVDENGVQTRTPADDDFIILPPQMVLDPGGVQVVRVQWVGESAGAESLSYYLNLAEVPVALTPEAGGAQVQVAFAFDVAVQVSPRNARAELELLGASMTTDAAGAPVARVEIENSGSRYAYLQDATFDLELVDAGGSVVSRERPTRDVLLEALGVTLLEPGKKRVADIPVTTGDGVAGVRGTVRAARE